MARNAFAVTLVALVVGAAAGFGDDDPVRKKLDAAKEEYKAEVEKFRAAVADWLDKREAEARKDGNKKLVDQVRAERETFTSKGDLPQPAPAALKAMPKAARSKLEGAYEAAVREYTKANQDDRAAAVERELSEFRKGGGDQKGEPRPPDRDRELWVQPKGYFLKGVGKDWFEKWESGKEPPNLFFETQRTAEFVELRHALVAVTYRLYKDRATIKDERISTEFKPAYVGEWRPRAK